MAQINPKFNEILLQLRVSLKLAYSHDKVINTPEPQERHALISKIEHLIFTFLKMISEGNSPRFETMDTCFWENIYYDDRLMAKEVNLRMKHTDFGNIKSRSKFSMIILILSKIHVLLLSHATSTRRELYYENTTIFNSQWHVDINMREVCHMLKAPSWELGVLVTSKGLVAGPLILTLAEDHILDCNKPGGVLVPQDIWNIQQITSSASWILLIEKDATFQKLLDDGCLLHLGPAIFVTGKGFPDVNTRLLVCKLWDFLKIPILALVDADPHGIEIMCVYRFGSKSLSSMSHQLACPAIRWLGIHPSDIKRLAMASEEMTTHDTTKLHKILSRSYIQQDSALKREVQLLLRGNVKAEIEGASKFSQSYITNVYIPSKISYREFI